MQSYTQTKRLFCGMQPRHTIKPGFFFLFLCYFDFPSIYPASLFPVCHQVYGRHVVASSIAGSAFFWARGFSGQSLGAFQKAFTSIVCLHILLVLLAVGASILFCTVHTKNDNSFFLRKLRLVCLWSIYFCFSDFIYFFVCIFSNVSFLLECMFSVFSWSLITCEPAATFQECVLIWGFQRQFSCFQTALSR